jgi:hypothetical protein
MIQGLANGISAAIGWVTSAARRVASAAVAAAKSALGIHSPSTVFAEEVGKPSAQGIAEGLRKNFPKEMKDLRQGVPNLGVATAHASSSGQSHGMAFNPTINLHIKPGFYDSNTAAVRALTKDVFLALEAYKKDYVDR